MRFTNVFDMRTFGNEYSNLASCVRYSDISESLPLIGTDMSTLSRTDDSRKRGIDEFDYRIHPSSS